MRARDIMSTTIRTVPAGTTAIAAWEVMRADRIHHLLVGTTTKPLGLISARDLGGSKGGSVRKGAVVDDLMSTALVTVNENDTVRQIANTLRGRAIGCVLVTNGRRATGIITVSDLLELIGRGVERPVAVTTRRTLSHRVPHRKLAAATGVW